MSLPAVHAPWLTPQRRALARVLLHATGAALLLSFMGVFGLADAPAALRTLYLLLACWSGAALAILAYALARRLAWARTRFWLRVLCADLFLLVPQGLLLWASTALFGRPLEATTLPLFLLNTFVVSGAFLAAGVAPVMDAVTRQAALAREAERTERALAQERGQTAAPAPQGRFRERLPRHLREAELWALKAEDHYLRVITSAGEALLRLRMSDALSELQDVEGARTHRSWWLARSAVRGLRRGGGRIALLLPDGREVPVARACAKPLREAGWL